jgi:CBS domain containing-hemolysin-like protein
MIISAGWWLFFNFLTIIILAFYSMIEMACVSLNKVRLHYYVSQGDTRAIYLNSLLQNPSRLFGTTLIGVNVAMVVGSECAREFFSALGLSPDWAPLPQILLVVIFGELAPMFAARHYSEHVAMLGARLLYASATLMTPILAGINLISKIANRLLYQTNSEPDLFLSQEELQKILEEHGEEYSQDFDSEEFNTIAANIFHLRVKNATQIMTPLKAVPMIASNGTVVQMRAILKKTGADYLLVYHNNQTNIVGLAFPRDLVRVPNTKRVRDYARPPWFVTENTKAMQILKQFRRNNQTVAVILNDQGAAVGVLNLDDLLEEIIGKVDEGDTGVKLKKSFRLIERTLSGEMLVSEFNRQFEAELDETEDLTLAQFIASKLGHVPEEGDSIYIAPFEFEVKEASLLGAKTILVISRPS